MSIKQLRDRFESCRAARDKYLKDVEEHLKRFDQTIDCLAAEIQFWENRRKEKK